MSFRAERGISLGFRPMKKREIPRSARNDINKLFFWQAVKLAHWRSLNLLAKKLHNHISDESGNHGNRKIRKCENILNGECQRLAPPIAAGKLTHQKI